VLDVEVLRLAPDVDEASLERILERAAELGARHALTIALHPEAGRTAERFAWLCERADPRAIRPVLEFMAFTAVRSLEAAVAIVGRAAHPAGGVLVDALHLVRSGGRPEDLARVEPALLPYAQICDAGPPPARDDAAGRLAEALSGRRLPGEGDLPLVEIVSQLPAGCPLSCEILSSELARRFRDPHTHARAVLTATRRALGSA